MDYRERIEKLKQLIDAEILLTDGTQLVMEKQSPQGQPINIPVAIFVRKPGEDPDKVYLGTPTGLPLFVATDLQKHAEAVAKKQFLKNMDKMITDKTTLLKITE